MSDHLRVSCVVPTHDRPLLLRETLASIAAQTRCPDEVIVSDDLGSVEAREVVDRVGSTAPYPVMYLDTSEVRGGTAGASRNAGAAKSSADVLAFLDDDDQWAPTYLAKMLSLLSTSESDFVVSWTYHQKGDFRIVGNSMRPAMTFPRALFPNPGMTGSNFVIRHQAFDQVGGFDPGLRVSNDIDLCARLLREQLTYAVVPEPLVYQIGHSGEHLTSRGARRAEALEAYRAKWHNDLSRAQHRNLRRFYHSALRGKDQPLPIRLHHTALQLFYSPPSGLAKGIQLRLKGKRDMFNG